MRNIIGIPARGTNFYERNREITRITQSLSNGNNIQITAPRRVGKTSILWHLLDNDIAQRNYIYVDTESIDSEDDFYKKILSEIIRNAKVSQSQSLHRAINQGLHKTLKKIKSIKIAGTGLEFNHEPSIINYFEELQNFLEGYAQSEQTDLILLIDEFPQTIENLKQKHEDLARSFLKSNRSLRLNPALQGKVKFIYTGSIGLNYTVALLNATATINDLNSIEVGPLTRSEANDFFQKLLQAKKMKADDSGIQELQEVLQWYIPFHIQLIAQEVLNHYPVGSTINREAIQYAIKQIIDLRNQNHFDHYYSRLRAQFKDAAFTYSDELLKRIAVKGSLLKAEAADLAIKNKVSDDHRRILESLIYDGYIHLSTEAEEYRFNSPMVRMWWQKFIC